MPVSGSEFLQSAQSYLSNNTEIHYRNAASRAYYAIYHEITGKLRNIPEPQGTGVHQSLYNYLVSVNKGEEDFCPRALKGIGYQLNQCKAIRTRADYLTGEDFSQTHADSAIAISSKALQKIQGLVPVDLASSS